MRTSLTLSFYIGRQFFLSFLMLFGLFLMLIVLFDSVELLRRAASKPDITLGLIIQMALLRLPNVGHQMLPFAVLFGGMLAFWRLTRSHELVVARAAGVSVWQFLLPPLLVTVALGALQVGAINPLGSLLLSRFEQLESRHFEGQASLLSISRSGLWLRQANPEGQTVIHARRIKQDGNDVVLSQVSVFVNGEKDAFIERLEADTATLGNGGWELRKVRVYRPGDPVRAVAQMRFDTDLTLNRIQDSFAPPEALSFWDLPEFIETLEKSGFTAIRHRLHFHSLLATPLLLCAMVLIAATFTLRHTRKGGTLFVITGGVMAGFLLFFFSNFVFALGMSDRLPIILAAWAPSGISTLLGLAMLFHLEDG